MARALWTGTITFGLVNIPIRLYAAVRDQSIHFHLMSPDGTCRLRRKLYCPETNEEFDFKSTARGVEVAPGQYVLVEQSELQELKPEKGDTLGIEKFVDASEVDPLYFDRTYFIGPAKGGKRAYELLRSVLEGRDTVALGRFVMRDKEHLVVIRAHEGALCLHTLNYQEDIVPWDEIPDLEPSKNRLSDRERKLAEQLVESMTGEFHPEQYHDRFREEVAQLVERKAQGEPIAPPDTPEEEPPPVIDLMEALQRSLRKGEKTAKASRRGSSRKTPKRKAG